MASESAISAAEAAEIRRERMSALRDGMRAIAPALVANATWGLVTGVAMVKSGMPESVALAITLLVYAGSAQLTSLPLLAAGAPLWLVFAAGCVVNLRFVIFGAALQPYFRDQPILRRFVLGYITSDISFVLFMSRYGDTAPPSTREQRWYYLGTIVPGWVCWQVSSIVGICLGALVPAGWSLDFAATLALLAFTVPLANSRPMLAAMLAAGVVAWVGQTLPLRLGLAAAVMVGIVTGLWAERRLQRARKK